MSALPSWPDVSAGLWHDVAEHRIAPKRTRALSEFWSRTWGRSPAQIFRLHAVPRTGPEENRLLDVPENVIALDVASFVRSDVEAMFVRGEHLKVVQDIVRLCWDEADVLLRPASVKTTDEQQLIDDNITPTPTSVDEIERANPFRKENGHPVREIRSKVRGLAVVGHPGIGKTLWLYLVLVLRLSAELPTVFQIKPDTFTYFDEGGVGTFSLSEIAFELRDSLPATTWWLADSNPDMTDVPKAAVLSHRFVLQAAVYRTDHAGWMSKMPRLMYAMRAWTIQELLIGCAFSSMSPDDELDFACLVETLLPAPLIVYPHVGGSTTHAALRMEIQESLHHRDYIMRLISNALDGSTLFTDGKLFDMCNQVFLVAPVLDRLCLPALTPLSWALALFSRQVSLFASQFFQSWPKTRMIPCYRSASWPDTFEMGRHFERPLPTCFPPAGNLRKGPQSAGYVAWTTSQIAPATSELEIYRLDQTRWDRYQYGELEPGLRPVHGYHSSPRLPLDSTVLYKPMAVDGILPGFDMFLVDGSLKSAIVYRLTLASSRKLTSTDLERFKSWGISRIHFIVLLHGPHPDPLVVYLPEDDSLIATKECMELYPV